MPCVLDPRRCRGRGCKGFLNPPWRLQAELGAPLISGHGAAGAVEVARALGVEVGCRQYAPYWRYQCGGVLEDSGGDSRAGHVRGRSFKQYSNADRWQMFKRI